MIIATFSGWMEEGRKCPLSLWGFLNPLGNRVESEDLPQIVPLTADARMTSLPTTLLSWCPAAQSPERVKSLALIYVHFIIYFLQNRKT